MLDAYQLRIGSGDCVQASGATSLMAPLRLGARRLLWAMHESRRRQASAVLRYHPGLIEMLGAASAPATSSDPSPSHKASRAELTRIRSRVLRVWSLICEWRRRARDRDHLQSLSRRAVADFCVSACDADYEANKPFWRA